MHEPADRADREGPAQPVAYDYKILPPRSYIPFNPNPHFTGRHAELLDLYLKMIGNLNKIGINQVGMGGIGKTQLAVEFACRFGFGFPAVYWVQGSDPAAWLPEFVSIARDRLQLPVKDPDKPEAGRQYVYALQEHFKERPGTLVVMDNVASPSCSTTTATSAASRRSRWAATCCSRRAGTSSCPASRRSR